MTTHTPGPWKAEWNSVAGQDCFSLRGPNDESIVGGCGCCGSPWCDLDDGRLIAAAPDLLAQLRDMRERFYRCATSNGSDAEFVATACANADAAIAKATGET